MKTPREILLSRHQSATPNLNAIRRGMVAELNNKETKEQNFPAIFVSSFLCCLKNIWLELIWPSRRIWAGLAAVWILIFVANFSMRDHSQPQIASAPPSPQILLAFRQQEQLLTELIGPIDPPVAEPAKPNRLLPTSLRQGQIIVA
jgi:hypothetical protein